MRRCFKQKFEHNLPFVSVQESLRVANFLTVFWPEFTDVKPEDFIKVLLLISVFHDPHSESAVK